MTDVLLLARFPEILLRRSVNKKCVLVITDGHNETINGKFTEEEHTEIWQSRMREVFKQLVLKKV